MNPRLHLSLLWWITLDIVVCDVPAHESHVTENCLAELLCQTLLKTMVLTPNKVIQDTRKVKYVSKASFQNMSVVSYWKDLSVFIFTSVMQTLYTSGCVSVI